MALKGKDRVIVMGGGFMSELIVAQLYERGATVVVVPDDKAPDLAERVAAYHVIPIKGDPYAERTLVEAGIAQAACLLAVSDNDSLNLEVALKAKKLQPDLRIVISLFDNDLATRLDHAFGIRCLSSSTLAASRFVSDALDLDVAACQAIEGHHIIVYRSDPGHNRASRWHVDGRGCIRPGESPDEKAAFWLECHLDEKAVRHRNAHRRPWRKYFRFSLRQWLSETRRSWRSIAAFTRGVFYAVLLIMLVSTLVFSHYGGWSILDSFYFVVTTLTTTGYGDLTLHDKPPALKLFGIGLMIVGMALLATIYAIVADRVLAARVEYLLGMRGVRRHGHAVVVGLGKIGYRAASEIFAMGEDVVGIEPKGETENVAKARKLFPVVVGDASRTEVLRRACVDRAEVILALTNDTVLNLDVCFRAKELNPQIKTILRTHEPALTEHFRELGLDHVVSTAAIASPSFVDAALSDDILSTFSIGDQTLQIVKERAEKLNESCVPLLRQAPDHRFELCPNGACPRLSGWVYCLRATQPCACDSQDET